VKGDETGTHVVGKKGKRNLARGRLTGAKNQPQGGRHPPGSGEDECRTAAQKGKKLALCRPLGGPNLENILEDLKARTTPLSEKTNRGTRVGRGKEGGERKATREKGDTAGDSTRQHDDTQPEGNVRHKQKGSQQKIFSHTRQEGETPEGAGTVTKNEGRKSRRAHH